VRKLVYFTADLHLGHRAIINMQNRPFEDVEEMNRTLITNYNAVVSNADQLTEIGN
jgi:calcineurin-like phosphoesterase family protein